MYGKCKVVHIVAVGANGEIGANNKLLWNIREDMKFFREKTLGHAILMGRKTFDSLPKKLDRRVVYRVSREESDDSVNLEQGLHFAGNIARNFLHTDTIFIAGGAEIYKATEHLVDEVYLTQVYQSFPNADAFYKLPEGFELLDSDEVSDSVNSFDFVHGITHNISFQRYKRK